MDVFNPMGNENFMQAPSENISDFVINFVLVRTLTVIPTPFENLIWKIIKMFPVGCTTLHVVADSYRGVSSNPQKGRKGELPQKSM